MISDRLKSALNAKQPKEETSEATTQVDAAINESAIITTDEKLEAYHIIKSILRSKIPVNRLDFRDAKSYFTIIMDDNNRKLCRLYLNSPTNKAIAFVDDEKKEIKHKIDTIDDIYQFTDTIRDWNYN